MAINSYNPKSFKVRHDYSRIIMACDATEDQLLAFAANVIKFCNFIRHKQA